MRYPVLLVASLIAVGTSTAQAPTIAWQRCLGSGGAENAYDVVQAADSSYVLTGFTTGNGGNVSGHHPPAGIGDAWLCRLLPDGSSMTWSQCFGGSEDDNGMSVIQTDDGGFLMAGYTRSTDGNVTFNHGDYDCWLVKTDALGALEWQQTYGGTAEDRANSVLQAADGGYVVTGCTWSNDGDVSGQHGIADLWLFKVNSIGTLQWQYTYGGTLYETGNQIIHYKDGYAMAGSTFSHDGDIDDRGGSPCDFWLLTTDTAGTLLEAVSYGGSGFDVATSLTVDGNNGLVITGYSDSNDGDISAHHSFYDAWTIRVDELFDIVWEHSYGGVGYEEGMRVVAQPGGGFVLAGYADTDDGDVSGVNNIGYADYWIWRIDDNGNLLWQTPLGGFDDDQGYAVVASVEGGWLVTGIGKSIDGDVLNNHSAGAGDFWCVKLEDDLGTGIAEQSPAHSVVLSPDPSTGSVIHVLSPDALLSIEVLDATGKVIAKYGGAVRTLTAPEVAGTYLVRAMHADGHRSVVRLVRY